MLVNSFSTRPARGGADGGAARRHDVERLVLARAASAPLVEVAVERRGVDAVERHRDLAHEEIDVGLREDLGAARKWDRRVVRGAVDASRRRGGLNAIGDGRRVARRGGHGCRRAVAARHRHRGERHAGDERALDVADDLDAADVARVGLGLLPSPAHQRGARPDLEREDDHEQPHLDRERVARDVVRRRLLGAGEQPPESSREPRDGGDGPPRVADERAADGARVFGIAQRVVERARPRPHAGEPHGEGEEVEPGEEEAERHGAAVQR